jgi:hypothetical protein
MRDKKINLLTSPSTNAPTTRNTSDRTEQQRQRRLQQQRTDDGSAATNSSVAIQSRNLFAQKRKPSSTHLGK